MRHDLSTLTTKNAWEVEPTSFRPSCILLSQFCLAVRISCSFWTLTDSTARCFSSLCSWSSSDFSLEHSCLSLSSHCGAKEQKTLTSSNRIMALNSSLFNAHLINPHTSDSLEYYYFFIQLFRDVVLCHWASSFQAFNGTKNLTKTQTTHSTT